MSTKLNLVLIVITISILVANGQHTKSGSKSGPKSDLKFLPFEYFDEDRVRGLIAGHLPRGVKQRDIKIPLIGWMSPFDNVKVASKHTPWYLDPKTTKPVKIKFNGQRFVSSLVPN